MAMLMQSRMTGYLYQSSEEGWVLSALLMLYVEFNTYGLDKLGLMMGAAGLRDAVD